MNNDLFNELVKIITKKENKNVFNDNSLIKHILGDDISITKKS